MESIQKNSSLSNDAKKICAHLLAKAFLDYPLYVYGIKDKENQEKKLNILFQTLVEFTSRYGVIYTVGEPFKAVMLILPSTQIPISNWKMFLSGATHIFFEVGPGFLFRNDRVMRIQEQLHHKYMPDPHQYGLTLAVDPVYQGQKLASKIFTTMLDEMRIQKTPCYLETNKEINSKIYQSIGFRVLNTYQYPFTEMTLYQMRWDP